MLGVNIIGDLTARRGLTEAARLTIQAMQQQQIEISLIEQLYEFFPADQRDSAPGFEVTHTGNFYPINLIFYGIAGFHHISDDQLARITGGKYTIAHWVWEFLGVPEMFRPQMTRVDEIWTSGRFCQDVFAPLTDRPVVVIPHPIPKPLPIVPDRAQFGIPAGRYMFLFIFDTAGSITRKNPEAVIEAFRLAFGRPEPDGPILVIKARHIDANPAYKQQLTAKIEQVGGILLSEHHTRAQVNNLMACTNCYVSLHRSEGFGLTIAEAMALGKPIIATNYSGNTDYMNAANSFPVAYTLRPVAVEDHDPGSFFTDMYQGQKWAEPSIEDAARWMRYVIDNPDDVAERGHRAASDIQAYCSPEVVGTLIKDRLETILAAR